MTRSDYFRYALNIDEELIRSRSFHIPGTTFTIKRHSGYNSVIDSEKSTDVFNYTSASELAGFLEQQLERGVK